MKKLYIFDLDGTLIDSVASVANCMNDILIEYGFNFVDKIYYKKFMGDGPVVLGERIITYIQERDQINFLDKTDLVNKLVDNYVAKYNLLDDDLTRLYPNIRDSLDFLKSKDIKLGICTNKPLTATINIIQKLFPKNYFDYISGFSNNKKRKPDPELLEDILRIADTNPKDILYFGDTMTDILTARNASINMVAVTWGFRNKNELLEADWIINNPIQIKDFINE